MSCAKCLALEVQLEAVRKLMAEVSRENETLRMANHRLGEAPEPPPYSHSDKRVERWERERGLSVAGIFGRKR